MRKLFSIGFAVLGLCACTIAQLHKDVSNREGQVQTKQAELEREEAKQAELRRDAAELQNDLKSRELSLEDVQSRLEQVQRDTARTVATTKERQAKKQQLQLQLQKYQGELAALRQSSDMKPEEKRKKLEHLKLEIAKSLELLVNL